MELNKKDILNAAAAATSEFVKNLYSGSGADENEEAVTFETTITLLDKDSTPITMIRSTKTTIVPAEEPAEAEAETAEAKEEQPAAPEAPTADVYRPFPGFFGYPYGAMPVTDPNAAAMPGVYYGMPYPYAEAVHAGAPVPQQSAPAQAKPAPAAKPAVKTPDDSVQNPVVKTPKVQEREASSTTKNQLGTVQLSPDSVREATPDKDRDKVVSMPAEKNETQSEQATSRAEKIDLLLKKYSNI